MMDVLVTYDIATDTPAGRNRLAQVAKICESYGIRAQYSVFECRIDDVMFNALVYKLSATISSEVDSVNFYRLSGYVEECRISIGRRAARDLGDPWIL